MPTPGMGIQTMVGSSQHASREAPIEENDVQQISDEEENGVEDDEVVGQGNVPRLAHKRDENGKIIIRPVGKGLALANEVANAINYAIRKQFYTPIYNWSVFNKDEDTKKIKVERFKSFGEKLSWDPRDHDVVYHVFEQKGAKRLSDMVTKARKKEVKPAWIGDLAWTCLKDYWKSEDFLKISNQNKINRSSK
ncbi:unnamed protein product [Trifolium pratense]|uniref:Uncharacterized protein n=2 Tax=Trifolium pratense TaxID=57577 RepID=A0ACB0JJ02_TRIPR|nr:unnamed protein product [Trifolium pratense]